MLMVIPLAFAEDNLTISSDNDVLTSDKYYFDVNNTDVGNGSYNNPYKSFSIENISDNSEVYFASGQYYFDKSISYSNISFIGQNTVLNGNGYTLGITGNVSFKNITLTNLHIVNKDNLSAFNTVFNSLIPVSGSYDNTYGGAIYAPSNKNIFNFS